VEAVELRIEAGRVAGAELVDRRSGEPITVRAGAVVNAAGPWVDQLRRLESARAGTSVRLSKGAHLVLEGGQGWTAALTTPLAGGRVSFAIPWEGMLLLGTTDQPFHGDAREVAASDDDQRQILAEAAQSLEPELLDPARVRSRFAGLRVLPVAAGSTARTRRETVIGSGPAGMVSVAGGKLTTWRAIGQRAAAMALESLGRPQPPPDPAPLPGAGDPAVIEATLALGWPQLGGDVRAALARHYGTEAARVLEPARERPELLERIVVGGPDLWAQVPFARDHEWADDVEDVLARRTTVAVRGGDGEAVRARTAQLLEERG
jgi:glycerol-3-phosphate dehydrogenase